MVINKTLKAKCKNTYREAVKTAVFTHLLTSK